MTDAQGFILHASALGARLLSMTPRSLPQRNLIVFFEQDRDQWRAAMSLVRAHGQIVRSGRLRPKEHRPIDVRVEISAAGDDVPPALLWTFQTASGA